LDVFGNLGMLKPGNEELVAFLVPSFGPFSSPTKSFKNKSPRDFLVTLAYQREFYKRDFDNQNIKLILPSLELAQMTLALWEPG
jgi:hypothetical protein